MSITCLCIFYKSISRSVIHLLVLFMVPLAVPKFLISKID